MSVDKLPMVKLDPPLARRFWRWYEDVYCVRHVPHQRRGREPTAPKISAAVRLLLELGLDAEAPR